MDIGAVGQDDGGLGPTDEAARLFGCEFDYTDDACKVSFELKLVSGGASSAFNRPPVMEKIRHSRLTASLGQTVLKFREVFILLELRLSRPRFLVNPSGD